MDKKLDNLKTKVNEKLGSNVLKLGSELTDFGLLDTPFDTINNLIGGVPIGRFTTVAG